MNEQVVDGLHGFFYLGKLGPSARAVDIVAILTFWGKCGWKLVWEIEEADLIFYFLFLFLVLFLFFIFFF